MAWELLIVPYTRDDTLSLAEKLVSIAYPLGDVLLLAVAARLLFGPARADGLVRPDRRSRSSACSIADPLYALLHDPRRPRLGQLADAGWILAYLFFGAAALHPSMRRVSEPVPETAPKLTPRAPRAPRRGRARRARRARVPAGAASASPARPC